MQTGADLIKEERTRQIEKEGWTAKHDSTHEPGELVQAAVCYALHDKIENPPFEDTYQFPWGKEWWKPSDYIRNLVKAGALIAAEIDRHNAEL